MTAALREMEGKDHEWLSLICSATDSSSGQYPGALVEFIPDAPALRLSRAGYITTFIPHNTAHKERWIITQEGRALLAKETG